MTERLQQLKQERARIDDEIRLIEQGISKAAYDAAMASQLVTINDRRRERGEAPLTVAQFMAGVE